MGFRVRLRLLTVWAFFVFDFIKNYELSKPSGKNKHYSLRVPFQKLFCQYILEVSFNAATNKKRRANRRLTGD